MWPGTEGERILQEGPSVPVCSPSLLGRRKRLDLAQLLALPLLHLTTRLRAWHDWLAAAGAALPAQAMRGPRYDLYTMLAQAAAAGVGVALIPRILIAEELAQGRLVMPLAALPAEAESRKAYYFAHRRGLAPDDKVLQLRGWLLAQAA